MKYVCDVCERLVEPTGVAPIAQLSLLCSRCGEPTAVRPAAPAAIGGAPRSLEAGGPVALSLVKSEGAPEAEVEAAVAPEERCPKCTYPRSGESCPKCGLVFALYAPDLTLESARTAEELSRLLAGTLLERSKRLGVAGPEQLMRLARACRLRLAEVPDDVRAQSLLEDISARSIAQVMAFAPVARSEHALGNRGKLVAYAAMGLGLLTAVSVLAYALAHLPA